MTLTPDMEAALMALPAKGSKAYEHTAIQDGLVHARLADLSPSRCGFYIKISLTPEGAAMQKKLKERDA